MKRRGSEKSGGFFQKPTVFEESEKSQNKSKEEDKTKKEKGRSAAGDAAGRAQSLPARFSPESPAYQAAVYLDRQIQARLEGQKPAGEKRLQAWALEFDRCHRLDGYSWEDMGQVLRFSQQDRFWQANILSGGMFREKYVQLLAKMQAEKTSRPDFSGRAEKEQDRQAFPDYGDKEAYL